MAVFLDWLNAIPNATNRRIYGWRDFMGDRFAVAYFTTGGCSMIHELDENGEQIHVDIDPFIPTGICAHCAVTEQETIPPEDR